LLEGSRPLSAAAVADLVRQGSAVAPVTAVQVGPVLLGWYDTVLQSKEVLDVTPGREGAAGASPEGAAPAAVPRHLRGAGAAGAAGGVELRALPAGAGGAGVPGATAEADRPAAAGQQATAGEELAGVGCEAVADEGGAAGAGSAGGIVPGPARECAGVRG